MLIAVNPRRGFTLVEVVIALAIIALISAVVVSQVAGRLRDSRSAALAQTLGTLSDAIMEYRADVRRYPRNLLHLSTAPAYGTTDLCNQNVPASFLGNWRGPYLKSVVTASGVTLQEMTISDALELSPAGPYTSATNGAIVILTSDVDSTIARKLETQFDGGADYATGAIRYVHLSNGKGELRFAVPVRGC